MAISGVSGSGYVPLPTFTDMAAVLAARPSMAEMSTKAAVQAVGKAEDAAAATQAAAGVPGGKLDIYM